MALPAIVAYGISAIAGIGINELAENILVRRTPPTEAVRQINWIRVITGGLLIAVIIFFVSRKFVRK